MKKKNGEGTEPRKLIIVSNRTEADRLTCLLNEYGIPSYIKEYGPGSLYGTFLGAFGDSGVHIYVPEPAYEKAREILSESGLQEKK